ncbi:MAG: hypothetical protein ACLQBD_23610 [Syntrophobacteraceae bacterium]
MDWSGGQLLHDERLIVQYRLAIIEHRSVQQLCDLISAVDSVPGFFGLLDQFESALFVLIKQFPENGEDTTFRKAQLAPLIPAPSSHLVT